MVKLTIAPLSGLYTPINADRAAFVHNAQLRQPSPQPLTHSPKVPEAPAMPISALALSTPIIDHVACAGELSKISETAPIVAADNFEFRMFFIFNLPALKKCSIAIISTKV